MIWAIRPKYPMRNFIDMISEATEEHPRAEDQQYLMDFYNDCIFIAKRHRSQAAWGAMLFLAMAEQGKVEQLEAMFNDELLPYLIEQGYPDKGSEEWAKAQEGVTQHFYDVKREGRDISFLA
jgi:hypothetical protein